MSVEVIEDKGVVALYVKLSDKKAKFGRQPNPDVPVFLYVTEENEVVGVKVFQFK